MSGTPQKTRELTGKHVLFWFLGFFALVFAVNGALVKAATSTFGGVETSSSYKAGLMFKQDIAAAEQQDALNWRVRRQDCARRRRRGYARHFGAQ